MKTHDRRGQPRGYFLGGDWDESATADVLIDSSPSDRIDTGLLDAAGNPIYRRRPTIKFGFVP